MIINTIFWIGLVILVIWLIINRVNQTENEKFDKRKN